MKMVISPAKSLNFESNLPTEKNSNPCFLAEANHINELLKEKTPAELSQLMKISEKLGNLNWERNQNFKTPFNKENARPAVYTFDGDVYTGLDVYTLPLEKIKALQDSLWILQLIFILHITIRQISSRFSVVLRNAKTGVGLSANGSS